MQNVRTCCIVVIALLFCSIENLMAQGLGQLNPVACYTLIGDASECNQWHPDAQIVNSPFQGNDGVFCNGVYWNSGDPDHSIVRTPALPGLYDEIFAMRIEFRIDSIPSTTRPIVIMGDGWRYLGVQVRYDGNLLCEVNGANYEVNGVSVSEGTWHEIICKHTRSSGKSEFWYDGTLVFSRTEELQRDDQDNRISNNDFSSGKCFRGNLRNLNVYSTFDILSETHEAESILSLFTYPNPVSDYLSFGQNEEMLVQLTDMSGRIVLSAQVDQGEELDLRTLEEGVYCVTAYPEDGKKVLVSRIVRARR